MASAITAEPRGDALRSALRNFAAALVCCASLAVVLGAALDPGSGYVLRVVAIFAIGSFLFVPILRRDHPFAAFGPANRVTMARGVLTSTLAGFLGAPVTPAAAYSIVGLGLVALILDGFDGKLARSSRMASVFGARYDMETDAFLILVFGILAWQLDKAGAWVVLPGLLRYLFIAAGWALPWMRGALPPSRRRQTVCVIQVAVMLAVLLPLVSSPWSDALSAATLVVLGYSFFVDVLWLYRSGQPAPAPRSKAAKGL